MSQPNKTDQTDAANPIEEEDSDGPLEDDGDITDENSDMWESPPESEAGSTDSGFADATPEELAELEEQEVQDAANMPGHVPIAPAPSGNDLGDVADAFT